MIAAARTVNEDLTEATALQAVINENHYWEFAPANAKTPLITYSLRENRRPSKDGGGDYDVTVRCFGKNLQEAAEIGELAKDAMIDANYKYRGAESGYTDIEPFQGVIELNFNFKI